MTEKLRCIYPISPNEHGRMFALVNGYKGIVTVDSTTEVALNTAVSYFSRLSADELDELNLHPDIVKRPDFIDGVLELTRYFASVARSNEYFAAFDRNPHFDQDETASLEEQFAL